MDLNKANVRIIPRLDIKGPNLVKGVRLQCFLFLDGEIHGRQLQEPYCVLKLRRHGDPRSELQFQ